jgi:phosphatidylinositol alpha-1,6-mannosyltransferase
MPSCLGYAPVTSAALPGRFVVFTASFPFPRSAGSVEYVTNIFGAFPPSSVIFHAPASSEAVGFDAVYPQQIVRHPYIIHVVDGYRASRLQRVKQYVYWPLAALRIVLHRRFDMVYLGEYNPAGIGVLIAALLGRTSYVLLTYAEEVTYVQKRPVHAWLFRTLARRATRVITVSEYTRTLLQGLGVCPAKICKILPPIPTAKRVKNPDTSLHLREQIGLGTMPLLLTVGRLIERKGHTTVIEALPKIRRHFPDVRYAIVGNGPMQERLEELAERIAPGAVMFFHGLGDQDVATLYDSCTVFVMPHRTIPETGDTEGCPTVFLEASLHGKPVIGGNAGGVADAIIDGETGLIIDGTDVDAVADAIIRLLSDVAFANTLGVHGQAYATGLTPVHAAECLLTASGVV